MWPNSRPPVSQDGGNRRAVDCASARICSSALARIAELVAALRVLGEQVIGPVQIHVGGTARVAGQPGEEQRLGRDRAPGGMVVEYPQGPAEQLPGGRRDLRVRAGEGRFGAADLRLEDLPGSGSVKKSSATSRRLLSWKAWSASAYRMSVPAPLACGRASAPTARSQACPTPTVSTGGHRPGCPRRSHSIRADTPRLAVASTIRSALGGTASPPSTVSRTSPISASTSRPGDGLMLGQVPGQLPCLGQADIRVLVGLPDE